MKLLNGTDLGYDIDELISLRFHFMLSKIIPAFLRRMVVFISISISSIIDVGAMDGRAK